MERSLGRVLPIGDDAHQFRIRTELAVNFRFTAHTLNARAEAERRDFQNESVTRNDRSSKVRFFDAREKHQLLVTIGDLAQGKDGAALRQRFDHQHAGHHRGAREVALEKRLVDAYLLDADDTLERRQFDYPIDQQERITMRQKFLDAFGVENCFHCFSELKKADGRAFYRICGV
jgi:hypothetical protein